VEHQRTSQSCFCNVGLKPRASTCHDTQNPTNRSEGSPRLQARWQSQCLLPTLNTRCSPLLWKCGSWKVSCATYSTSVGSGVWLFTRVGSVFNVFITLTLALFGTWHRRNADGRLRMASSPRRRGSSRRASLSSDMSSSSSDDSEDEIGSFIKRSSVHEGVDTSPTTSRFSSSAPVSPLKPLRVRALQTEDSPDRAVNSAPSSPPKKLSLVVGAIGRITNFAKAKKKEVICLLSSVKLACNSPQALTMLLVYANAPRKQG